MIIGAGVTLYEALSAAGELEKSGISVRVLDPFTIKPIDVDTIIKNAKECGGNIITVEDHYSQGMCNKHKRVLRSSAFGLNIIVNNTF